MQIHLPCDYVEFVLLFCFLVFLSSSFFFSFCLFKRFFSRSRSLSISDPNNIIRMLYQLLILIFAITQHHKFTIHHPQHLHGKFYHSVSFLSSFFFLCYFANQNSALSFYLYEFENILYLHCCRMQSTTEYSV